MCCKIGNNYNHIQSFFYFLLKHKKAVGRSLFIWAPTPISRQCGFSCSSNNRKRTSVCICQGPLIRVLLPGSFLSLYLRGYLNEVLPSACNSHQGFSRVAMTWES